MQFCHNAAPASPAPPVFCFARLSHAKFIYLNAGKFMVYEILQETAAGNATGTTMSGMLQGIAAGIATGTAPRALATYYKTSKTAIQKLVTRTVTFLHQHIQFTDHFAVSTVCKVAKTREVAVGNNGTGEGAAAGKCNAVCAGCHVGWQFATLLPRKTVIRRQRASR